MLENKIWRTNPNIKESQYLSLLNQNTINKIDNKINEIRKLLIEIGKRFTNTEIKKYTQELYDIVKIITSSHESRVTYYCKLSNELRLIVSNIINTKKNQKSRFEENKLLIEIKYKRKSHYIAHDDDYHYGLKDIEFMFGNIGDYYKPILAKQSFYDKKTSTFNHQEYVCRGTRESSQLLDDYLDKVQPHLIQLIHEKQVNEL